MLKARSYIAYLDGLVLEPESVQGLDCLAGVIRIVVVDETVAQTLS